MGRVLFGRLGAELLAGGVSAGTLPVEEPSAPPAAPPAGGQPTAASPRSTATTAPRRPTATPDGAPAEPSSTSRPTEPATTRTPQPTNTAIVPTSTPRPPTSTPRPPTSTPTPNSFTDPPPTPPPGFPPDVGLPAQADTSGGAVANLDAATDSLRIGAPFCLGISGVPGGASEVTYTISGPDGDATVRDETTIFADSGDLIGQWRWAPDPGYTDGAYTLTVAIADSSGSVLLTETGSLALIERAPGSGQIVTTVRLGSRIGDSDVQTCGAGAHGSPGDQFATYLTGYTPREVVELHLYSGTTYKGLLETITLDDQGKGGLIGCGNKPFLAQKADDLDLEDEVLGEVSRVPLKRAPGGRVAGSTTQRCSRVTVSVWFFLGLPRGVGVRRSASEEWLEAGESDGLMSGLPEPPFRRTSSSRSC